MTIDMEKHTRCSLAESIAALRINGVETEKPVITTIGAGKILEIEGPASNLQGMVAIRSDGETYAVFSEDLKERATPPVSR
jgi:hypothetical protein